MGLLEENQRLIRVWQEDTYGIPVHLGRTATDTDPRVNGKKNRLYVRFDDGRGMVPAWNNGKFQVSWRFQNTALRVGRNRAGEWEIIGGDSQSEDIFHGDADQNALSPDLVGDLSTTTVPGRNVKPGRVRIWVVDTLQINAESFWYVNTAGNRARWTPTTANTLDLAAYVPAAVGGVNQVVWVAVDLNPDATAPALVATAGTSQNATLPALTSTSVETIPLTAGYLPLWAFRLTTGDTTEADIPLATEQEDMRFWLLGGSGAGSAVSIGEYMLDDDGGLMLDDGGNIMRDDG